MANPQIFYLCPKCFKLTEDDEEGHRHGLMRFDAKKLSEEQRKPLFDENGRLVTRAPIWFLDAVEKSGARKQAK